MSLPDVEYQVISSDEGWRALAETVQHFLNEGWEVTGGIITEGQGTYMVTVAWEGEGSGTITVSEETADGCEGSSEDFDVTIDDCTGIEELEKEGRLTFSPNPFNNSTIISFHLEQATEVTIHIYNHTGGLVEQIEEYKPSGKQTIEWNADNLPSGVYYLRMARGRFEAGEQGNRGLRTGGMDAMPNTTLADRASVGRNAEGSGNPIRSSHGRAPRQNRHRRVI